MEIVDDPKPKHGRGGRSIGGLIIVAIGILWLLKAAGLVIFPHWFFSWPMFLIAVGLSVGVRHRFYGASWFILMLIGTFFLVKNNFYHYEIADYMWPLALIALGIYIIFRPKHQWDWEAMHSHHARHHMHRHHHWKKWEDWQNAANFPPSGDDYIDSTSIFGGVNKVIVSKNFKGGDIVNIFGGCDINLTQADFTGTVTIELVQIFGGAKIVVPTDWKIVTRMTSVMGGIEDKRPPSLIKENPEKTLIIEGTSIFAGVSIQCY